VAQIFYTPPVVPNVIPRFDRDANGLSIPTTPTQRALFKYMKPLNRPVNTWVLSDGSVQTDLPVPIAGDGFSTSNLPLPMFPMDGHTLPPVMTPTDVANGVGPYEGASGGPFSTPFPYEQVFDATSGELVVSTYALSPYLVYWFQGGPNAYNISQNLAAILTAAGFAAYLS
jgi:hypothetical protein